MREIESKPSSKGNYYEIIPMIPVTSNKNAMFVDVRKKVQADYTLEGNKLIAKDRQQKYDISDGKVKQSMFAQDENLVVQEKQGEQNKFTLCEMKECPNILIGRLLSKPNADIKRATALSRDAYLDKVGNDTLQLRVSCEKERASFPTPG